jgi:hypothetical protein
LDGLNYEEYKKKMEKINNLQKTSNIAQNISNYPQKLSKKKFICKYCEKCLCSTSSLQRHLNICKDRIKDDEVKDSMTKLVGLLNKQIIDFKNVITKKDKQIDELIKKAGININTNTNTNTMNVVANINLLGYKETDRSHLTDNDILK